jgi:hypothetical protein
MNGYGHLQDRHHHAVTSVSPIPLKARPWTTCHVVTSLPTKRQKRAHKALRTLLLYMARHVATTARRGIGACPLGPPWQ